MTDPKDITAKIFRTTRKLFSLNQKDFALKLGITQGTVSKLENGTLGPDAFLWYQFCKEFNLHADTTYKSGYLFFKESLVFKGNEFKLGNLSLDRFIKVKEIYPFLETLNALGEKELYLDELKAKGIDHDIFLVPEYVVPFELLKDIVQFSITKMDKKDFMSSALQFFLADKTDLIQDMGYTYKQFVRLMNEDDNIVDIHSKGHDINISVKSDFKFSIEEQDTLASLIQFKAKAISQVLNNVFNLKSIKLAKQDSFNYSIGLSA